MNWADLFRWGKPNLIIWDRTSVPWRLAANKNTLAQAVDRKLAHNGNNTPKHDNRAR